MRKARGRRKKRVSRKGGRGRKKGGVSLSIKRFVKQTLAKNIETKEALVAASNPYGSLTGWTEVCWTTIGQGIAQGQRIGRLIKIKSIELCGWIGGGQSEVALDDSFNILRVIVAVWNLEAGLTPCYSQSIAQVMDVSKRYIPHLVSKCCDRQILINSRGNEKGSGDGYVPGHKYFRFRKSFKNLTIRWADDSFSYPNKRLIISILSDSTASPNPGFINGYVRVRWTDA